MTGLVLVHTFCRWPVEHSVEGSARAVQYISSEWLKLIIANAEQFCILAVSAYHTTSPSVATGTGKVLPVATGTLFGTVMQVPVCGFVVSYG
jgi:hypothetical protein